jgi:hypothetical protein
MTQIFADCSILKICVHLRHLRLKFALTFFGGKVIPPCDTNVTEFRRMAFLPARRVLHLSLRALCLCG